MRFKDVLLSKGHWGFYVGERAVLGEAELGTYPEVGRRSAREEEPGLRTLGLYWRERERTKKMKIKTSV